MFSSAASRHAIPDESRAPRAVALWGLALAAVAVSAASVVLAVTSDVGDVGVALLEWISVPYIVVGLIAWRRRPDSRLGPLMIAGGFATGLSALQFADVELVRTLAAMLDVLLVAVFLHVYLAFPGGRLRSTFERLLVISAYGAAIGFQVAKMMLGSYPGNLLEISAQPTAEHTVEQIQLVTLSVICLGGIGVLAARRRRGGRPRRRAVALLIDSFAVALLMIAVLFFFGAFDGPGFQTIQRVTLGLIGVSPLAFLVGLLDARLARSAVGDLVIELRADLAPAALRDALARALRDPSLTLAYWLPDFQRYVDLEGQPVEVPTTDGRTTTPIDRNGAHVAALLHDPALDDERELLDGVGAAAGIALENGRLQAELAARLEEVRGSRARVIEAGHNERKRLERNLHDGAQARLVALSLDLKLLEREIDDPAARSRLDGAQREIEQSLEELRSIAHGLHPAVLTGHGLAVALEQVAALAALPVRLTVTAEGRFPEPVEVAVYYVVTESLANVAKHAHADAASVDVSRAGGDMVVEVSDDGVGGADSERGSGLRGLADRVEALGGRLRVWTPQGGGTRVRAEIPCA